MQRTKVAVVTVAAGALALNGWLSTPATAVGKGSADKTFMMKAAMGGMAEVQLGQMAAKKGASAAVKQFGQHMVTDHSKANAKLKQVAASEGVTLPADVGAENKAVMAKLSKLSGAAFDRAYVSDMVKDHVEDVGEFAKESKLGKDQAAKGFAAKTLPTLKAHLNMIRMIQHNISGGKMGGKMSGGKMSGKM